ncbi:ABC transporter substrate-binding protein [Cytobacillus kochii]|uniref:ABC transporter substrate-binding protein n=1 Tax=Cytobacillus kochii TaxID=859143 RepID=UPI00203F0BD6|nr:iron-siderophore ABC transporter substrate-binding protein [Cytobacillus kochii]MCM3324911.1 iron-siderophore ABC transporter substrate-binding protein [Cytobacillus kochii]MCM3347297.1 iron-siderophore ABC transporter substrate-binding protein [Cytobacillus kochii]
MKKLYFIMLLFVLVLAGCMQKEEESNSGEENNNSNQTIVIEDASGERSFEGVQEKVVALEWSVAEELLAVGVQPAAVADVEGFNKWVTIDAKLDESVVDIGLRTEPNIEEIAKLEPDVIIGMEYQEQFKADLEKIAPVVIFDSSTEEAQKDLYAYMLHTLKQTGKLVGKEQEANEAVAHLEEKMAEAKENISAAQLKTNEFVFTQAYSANQAPTFRLFTENSTVSHTLEGIGLTNKIQDQDPQPSGFITTNVEGVSKYEEAIFLHTVQKDDPLFSNLEGNKAWNSLYFVENDLMYDVGAGVWTFGSVLSMETLVDHVEETLVK